MRAFRDLPIHQKLRRIVLPVVLVMGVIALAWVSADDLERAADRRHERFESMMKVVALNSAPAILFNDPQAAYDSLDTLRAVPDVASAVLYVKNGQVFAKYESAAWKASSNNATWFPRYETLARKVEVGHEDIGRIEFRVDLLQTYRGVFGHLAAMVAVIAAITLVTLYLFDRLLHSIVGPLLRLTATIGRVSKEGDYKLRAHKEGRDEIGTLVDGFNDMLAGIEARDAELERHRTHLQEEVSARTAELQQAKEHLEASLAEKEVLVRKLDELASHDGLTGLYNHRTFHKLLEDELARTKRYDLPLSLIMFDIDHFKKVNDTWGHQAGDDLLVALSAYVSANIRDTDSLARWGGEEFMLVTPGTGVEAAARLAEKLRASIERGNFGDIGRVTCSFGVTQSRAGDTVEDFTGRADTAMYAAKQGGRNRVRSYEPAMRVSGG